MQRVLITGLGAVTPLGLGAHRSFQRLLAGDCGIKSLRDHGPDFQNLPSQVAGLVRQGRKEDGGWTASEWLSGDDERHMSTFMQYAIAASEEAFSDAGWRPKTVEEQDRTGITLGSGIGSLSTLHSTSIAFSSRGPKSVSPYFVPQILINLAAGHVSMRYGLKGPSHALSTACTTGLHSIIDASLQIATGAAEAMLAGSAESCIHPLALAGFSRSGSLTTSSNNDPSRASRPFDVSRDGFVIGEGAGVLLLESYEHAKARGALAPLPSSSSSISPPTTGDGNRQTERNVKTKVYAEIAGFASTSDAHHITRPPTSGEGAFRAMRAALNRAHVSPHQLDYINAHATSTKLGDAAEINAIKTLFSRAHIGEGDNGENEEVRNRKDRSLNPVAISSFKGSIGHLLGAAGSVEAIWTALALKSGMIPPTLNLDEEEEDPTMAPTPGLHFVKGEAEKRDVRFALTNSFGFGGTNASVLLKKFED